MTERETSAEIDIAATDWVARIDRSPLEPAEQDRLNGWLAGDSRRRGAFVRAQAMRLHAHRAKALGPAFAPDAYRAAHLAEAAGMASPLPVEEPTRRRFLAWGASAAAVVVGGVTIATLGVYSPAEAYETRRGEIRLIPLSDGSQMMLNTASRAKVRFTKGERRVDLTDGEALFDVARNPARPFTVSVGETRIRAIGTSFTVQRLPGRPVEILVREGVVEIAPAHGPSRQVSANTRAIIANGSAIETLALASTDVRRELSWREGMLSFEDEPLNEAVEKFARYSDQRVRLAEPSIGRETVTGLFAVNDPRGFAESTALVLGLRAVPTPGGILLTH